jgi:uncharacterized protein YecE (DUF72 family)
MNSLISIGIAGWSYPDWQGIVYPRGTHDQLGYVSRFVDCIEINNTFYRPPQEKDCQSWLARTHHKKEFFFTAKLHQDFTHEGRIDPAMVRQFHQGFAPMLDSGKLRHLLMQFRYDFSDNPERRKYLQDIIGQFAKSFAIVLEVRHKSWQQPETLDFLGQLNVTVANLDYPVGADSFNLQNCTVGKTGYFRLHGRNAEKWFSKSTRDETYDYYYNAEELTAIKDRIQQLAGTFPSLVVVTNNHYRGAELANALELKAMLTGQKVMVPQDLMTRYPRLEEIALNRPLF